MKKKYVSLADMKNEEIKTCQVTHGFLKGVNDNVPKAIDVLLQSMYFIVHDKDVNTLESNFHSYAWHRYMEAPYSFRACYILYEKGYYLNACILLRSLLESFIQSRYLFNHKDQVSTVWAGKKLNVGKKEKYITFKGMFEEISPGFYENFYGRTLAGFAHGKIGANIFRIKKISSAKSETRMLPKFDVDLATYVINQVVAFLYGYLHFFPVFFDKMFDKMPQDLFSKYWYSRSWLQRCMDSHKKANPRSADWYRVLNRIINQ